MTTLAELVELDPTVTHGRPTQWSAWRWVVELADPDAGAAVVWHDVTGYCLGVELNRGADDYAGRWAASVATFAFRAADDRLAPWLDDTSATFGVHVRLGAGLLIRCGLWRVVDGTITDRLARGTWRVESWSDSAEDPRGQLRTHTVVGRDTLTDLVDEPVTAVAAQNWPDRVAHVLTSWPFGSYVFGAVTTDGATPAFELPARDGQASAVAELDATIDPTGLVAHTDRRGRMIVRPRPGDVFHSGLLGGAGTGAAWLWPDPVVFSHQPVTSVAYRRHAGDGAGFGLDDTEDNVVNRIVVTDPGGDYDVDDPASIQRYGNRTVQLSWIAPHDSLVDLLLDQRANATLQARPLVVDHRCANFFPTVCRLDYLDPVTVEFQTAPGRTVVQADGRLRKVTERWAPMSDGSTSAEFELSVDVDGAPSLSTELLPPTDLAVASVDHTSVAYSWTNPAQPSGMVPTVTQVRFAGMVAWADEVYPLTGIGWGPGLDPNTAYEFEVRYLAEVDGLVVGVSDAASIIVTTSPGPSLDDDMNAVLPDPDDGCDVEWQLQESVDGEVWVTIASGTEAAGGVVELGPELFDDDKFYRVRSREDCGGVFGDWIASPVAVPACSIVPTDPPFDDADLVMYVPELCRPDRILEHLSQSPASTGPAFAGFGAHDGSVTLLAGTSAGWVAVGQAPEMLDLVGSKAVSWRGLVTAGVGYDRLLWSCGLRIGTQPATGGWSPTLVVLFTDGSTMSLVAAAEFATDAVYTVSATFDEVTGTAELFVDGTSVGTVTAAEAPATTSAFACTGIYSIGATADGWATDAATWSAAVAPVPPIADTAPDVGWVYVWDATDLAATHDDDEAVLSGDWVDQIAGVVLGAKAGTVNFAAAVAALNGGPAVRFNNGRIENGALPVAVARPFTLVIVFNLSTIGSSQRQTLFDDNGTPTTGRHRFWNETLFRWAWFGGTQLSSANDTATAGPHLAVLPSLANGTGRIEIDGAVVATGADGANSLTEVRLGQNRGGQEDLANGHIAFVGIAAGDAKGHANWAALEAWITAKWGV